MLPNHKGKIKTLEQLKFTKIGPIIANRGKKK